MIGPVNDRLAEVMRGRDVGVLPGTTTAQGRSSGSEVLALGPVSGCGYGPAVNPDVSGWAMMTSFGSADGCSGGIDVTYRGD